MICEENKEYLNKISAHLWQLRNFSNTCVTESSNFDKLEVSKSNFAQIYMSLRNQEISESFANVLLDDELHYYYKQKPSNDKLKATDDFNKSFAKRHYNSQLNVSSILQLDCFNDLQTSQTKTMQSWLQEVQDRPSLSLTQSGPCEVPNNKLASMNATKRIEQKTDINTFIKSHSWNGGAASLNNQREMKRKFDDVQNIGDEETKPPLSSFKSAREQLAINQKKKFQKVSPQGTSTKKSLGSRPRNQCYAKFIPPSSRENKDDTENLTMLNKRNQNQSSSLKFEDDVCPKLKGIEPQLVELVLSEIMDHGPPIGWDDIAGLEFAKATIKEIVIWPMLRPDIFTGLRGPPKGILLFGPPGTGKTLIGKCIANQSGATFFSISASSLTSKWIGQAEKMVRALFAVASLHQPAVIFIDEIDSLLSQRSDSEHESSRRIKTEFFVQLDGATTSSEDRILVVGATNRPQEIDEAARRRLVKRLYIPLPDANARKQIITKLLQQQPYVMSEDDISEVVFKTDGYSGADVTNLCKDAALGPIRSLEIIDISTIRKDQVRPIKMQDFHKSLQRVKASVSQSDLVQYEDWNKIYGCGGL